MKALTSLFLIIKVENMNINKLKNLIARNENPKKSKRNIHEKKSISSSEINKEKECIKVLKEYVDQHHEDTFYFNDFYRYAKSKYKEEWVLQELSDTVLSNEKNFIGSIFQECRRLSLNKLPVSIVTDVVNTYFNARDPTTTMLVSRLFAEKTKISKHYHFWKDTYKWKRRLIKLGCLAEPLNEVFSTMHIQNPKHLYRSLKNQKKFAKHYKEPWAFYIMSGEINAVNYAISHYQLTDKTRTSYNNESPFAVALFSQNYKAVNLVIKKMPVDFYNITSYQQTPFHIAAWSRNVSQVEYVKCLIHHFQLDLTEDDGDEEDHDAYFYISEEKKMHPDTLFSTKQLLVNALYKPVEQIDREKFVDEEDKPIFTSSFKANP